MRRRIGASTVVVVVGASSGIGRAAALRFAERGAILLLAARSEESLDEVAAECRARGGNAIPVPTDVTRPEQFDRLVGEATSRFGGIDVWVAASSVFGYGSLEQMPAEVGRQIFDTNVHGTIDGIRAALPALRARRGVVVVIGSVFSEVAAPFVWAYVASKHAIAGFATSIRQELRRGPHPIDVAMVWPATIDTPIYQHSANYTGHEVQPLRPVVDPDRVARAIVAVAARPRRRRIVGVLQGAAVPIHAVAPGFVDRTTGWLTRRVAIRDAPSKDRDGTLTRPDPASNRVDGGWSEGTADPNEIADRR